MSHAYYHGYFSLSAFFSHLYIGSCLSSFYFFFHVFIVNHTRTLKVMQISSICLNLLEILPLFKIIWKSHFQSLLTYNRSKFFFHHPPEDSRGLCLLLEPHFLDQILSDVLTLSCPLCHINFFFMTLLDQKKHLTVISVK